MRVRALQNCQTPDIQGRGATYRRGPETNLAGVLTAPGEEFDVPDDMVVNREVMEVITPPPGGKVRYLQPGKASAAAAS